MMIHSLLIANPNEIVHCKSLPGTGGGRREAVAEGSEPLLIEQAYGR